MPWLTRALAAVASVQPPFIVVHHHCVSVFRYPRLVLARIELACLTKPNLAQVRISVRL